MANSPLSYGMMPNGVSTFIDANGIPLSGGLVYIYIPRTTTPLQTWQDSGQQVLNTNPIVLNASGQALIWGVDGQYRQIVQDQFGNVIWDQIVQIGTNEAQPVSPQVISATVPDSAGIALTDITAADITSISLPPGTWLVSGNVGNDSSIGVYRVQGWISLTSATLPAPIHLGFADSGTPVQVTGGVVDYVSVVPLVLATGVVVLELTKQTTVYLSTWAHFSAFGTDKAFGDIVAVEIAPGTALFNGNSLPTSNPGVGSGLLWNNGGFVVVA